MCARLTRRSHPLAVLEFKPTSINGRSFLFGLVSRRNRYRAGTRYFSRGIDQKGNVSNFNETEQLVLLDAPGAGAGAAAAAGRGGEGVRGDVRFSFVQTRGSVPVYWAEINNLRYKPDLKILDLSSTVRPSRSLLFLPLLLLEPPLTLPHPLSLLPSRHRPSRSRATSRSRSRSTARSTSSTSSTRTGTSSRSRRRTSARSTPWPTRTCATRTSTSTRSARALGSTASASSSMACTTSSSSKGASGARSLCLSPRSLARALGRLEMRLFDRRYYYHDSTASGPEAQRKQTSVVRTNCMDWCVPLVLPLLSPRLLKADSLRLAPLPHPLAAPRPRRTQPRPHQRRPVGARQVGPQHAAAPGRHPQRQGVGRGARDVLEPVPQRCVVDSLR